MASVAPSRPAADARPVRPKRMNSITVFDYSPKWAEEFQQLSGVISGALKGLLARIEHVGSTAVPGLPAKPIIDIDIIVPAISLSTVIERLTTIGYDHRGDLGIEGREAFFAPETSTIAHNLYACPRNSLALRNHLLLRDWLRSHPEDCRRYGELKRRLAKLYRNDIDSYVARKTDFITGILESAGIDTSEITIIRQANKAEQA